MEKMVLDATCGGRMMWFDKNHPAAIYLDNRDFQGIELCDGRKFSVQPDIIADFTALPFADQTFYLVVFDPPHLKNVGRRGYMGIKYGKLENDWEKTLKIGMRECMRVLKPGGSLIFKWSENQIKLKEILNIIDYEPLFGHRTNNQTHWMVFIKF